MRDLSEILNDYYHGQDNSVSNTISIGLILAITVLLASVVGVLVFNIDAGLLDDKPESVDPKAGVSLDNGVATLVDTNNKINRVILQREDGGEYYMDSVGETLIPKSGSYKVLAENENGEQTLLKENFEVSPNTKKITITNFNNQIEAPEVASFNDKKETQLLDYKNRNTQLNLVNLNRENLAGDDYISDVVGSINKINTINKVKVETGPNNDVGFGLSIWTDISMVSSFNRVTIPLQGKSTGKLRFDTVGDNKNVYEKDVNLKNREEGVDGKSYQGSKEDILFTLETEPSELNPGSNPDIKKIVLYGKTENTTSFDKKPPKPPEIKVDLKSNKRTIGPEGFIGKPTLDLEVENPREEKASVSFYSIIYDKQAEEPIPKAFKYDKTTISVEPGESISKEIEGNILPEETGSGSYTVGLVKEKPEPTGGLDPEPPKVSDLDIFEKATLTFLEPGESEYLTPVDIVPKEETERLIPIPGSTQESTITLKNSYEEEKDVLIELSFGSNRLAKVEDSLAPGKEKKYNISFKLPQEPGIYKAKSEIGKEGLGRPTQIGVSNALSPPGGDQIVYNRIRVINPDGKQIDFKLEVLDVNNNVIASSSRTFSNTTSLPSRGEEEEGGSISKYTMRMFEDPTEGPLKEGARGYKLYQNGKLVSKKLAGGEERLPR